MTAVFIVDHIQGQTKHIAVLVTQNIITNNFKIHLNSALN